MEKWPPGGGFTRQRFFAVFSGMIFHLKRFLRGVADGGGRRGAAPKAQEARNEGLATNVLEPGDAKPFKANLRCQFYSTENSEEPLTGKTTPWRPLLHRLPPSLQ